MTALVLFVLLGGGRDPFSPAEPPQADADTACAAELCRFAVSDLKLVAIVSGSSDPVAMFEDPYGKGLLAQRGSRIGKRGGRLTAILRECVRIAEPGGITEVCVR